MATIKTDNVAILSVQVGIELVRVGTVFNLQVKTAGGQEARFTLRGNGGELDDGIIQQWAREEFQKALVKRRRNTGAKDKTGTPVFEGDIVQDDIGEGGATSVVKWFPDYAAFIREGRYIGGGGWGTLNLEGVNKQTVVGNIFESPEKLVPFDHTLASRRATA